MPFTTNNNVQVKAHNEQILALDDCNKPNFGEAGPDLRFVVEANTEALVSTSNSRRSDYVMVQGRSI